MTKPYGQPPDTILREVELDYYSRNPYNIIINNITDDTVSILGDCGHFGRYGINIAEEMPFKKVYLCELRSEIGHATQAKRFCDTEDLGNIFFTVADAGCKGRIYASPALDEGTKTVSLPFKDETFDFAYTFELENFTDYPALFKELTRVLKPGGKLLIGVPNYYNFFHTIRKKMLGSEEIEYEKSFKHRELKALFQENGFYDIKISGVAPMQSLMRLSKVSKHKKILNYIKWWSLMKIVDMTLIRLIDLLTKGKFSDTFGFEIIGAGTKSSGQ